MSLDLARNEAFEDARRGAGLAVWDCARSWVGTPYEHCQRTKGVGVDCVNLILCASHEAGVFSWDQWDVPTQYSSWVNADQLRAQIDRLFRPVPDGEELWTGDMLIFRIDGVAQHVGLYGAALRWGTWPVRPRLIHASARAKRVVETDYERFWENRTVARYRWRIEWLDRLQHGGTNG